MSDFWKDKKVVITGARGFVGSFLVDRLVELEASVLGMDTQVRGHNHNSYIRYLDPRQSDVSNEGSCGAAFANADVVFNLAAHVGGLYYNVSHQCEQFWGNMQTLCPPAIAAARHQVPVFVQMSTVCIYASGYNDPASEPWGHAWAPEQANEGYAWAKRLGEYVCHWAFEGSKSRYVIARPTNMYGPRDYFDATAHVVPALIRKFTDGREEVEVFGGNQKREFLYVEDCVEALLTLAEFGVCGEAYNVGTGGDTQVSIKELALHIKELTGSPAEIKWVEDAPTGDWSRSTSVEKIHQLGWDHHVTLEEGLRRTIEWWLRQ